jgi:hypothetical protein
MNNELVKVCNEPKPILLHAWMQRNQQYKIEILQIFKYSCMASDVICVNDVLKCSCLCIEQTASYNGSYATKMLIFNLYLTDVENWASS